MGYLVPNANDTTSGNRFEALDQAEPDSLDFEVLGNGGSGVVTGCQVTTNSSATNVAVSAGTVVLNGVPYDVAAAAALAIPSAPADNRFDLVVVRVTAGVAALTVLQGTNSATNPSFPKSATVLTGAPATDNFNPSTDVLLAAVLRSGASVITDSRIIDKRVERFSYIVHQGTATPSSGIGNGPGMLYYKKAAANGTSSGVYVKTVDGSFVELAQNVGSHLPVGSAVIWPTGAAVPTGCIEANGQSLAVSAYPDLFAIYGYEHGGSGATFMVPDFNGKYLKGTTSTTLPKSTTVGNTFGADSITLTTAQLPSHTHTHAHTHTFSHSHGIDHTHGTGSTSSSGNHNHTPAAGGSPYGFVTAYMPSSSYFGTYQVAAGGGNYVFALPAFPNQQFPSTFTSSDGNHTHTVSVPTYSGSTTSQSTSTTGSESAANTGATGSGSSIDIRPASKYVRYIIRASLGAGTTSGDSAGEHIFSMSVGFADPIATGDYHLWVAAFDCTLTKVLAFRNGGTGFTVNVKVNDVDYALGTDLTTPVADTWTSSAAALAIAEGDVVEIEVVASTGSPAVTYVQVDFES